MWVEKVLQLMSEVRHLVKPKVGMGKKFCCMLLDILMAPICKNYGFYVIYDAVSVE